MIPTSQEASIICLLTACACVATASAHGADHVTLISDGTTIRGTLGTLSKTQVVITRSNDETAVISSGDIRDISFDREPPPLQSARNSELRGSDAAAIEQLQDVLSEYTGGDKRVRIEIEFLVARCQARQAFSNPAAERTALLSLQSFLQTHGNSYRTLEATLLLAKLLVGSDPDQAISLLQSLRKSGVDEYAMQAGVVLGRALLDGEKLDQARQVFDSVLQERRGKTAESTIHYDCRIGRAECLRKQGRLKEAMQDLETVIAEVPDDHETTLARAWIQLGDCYRLNNHHRAALLAYLHVDVLYPQATDEHAEALHRLMPLWETAGHSDRARDAQTRLKAQYPDSRWAQQTKG